MKDLITTLVVVCLGLGLESNTVFSKTEEAKDFLNEGFEYQELLSPVRTAISDQGIAERVQKELKLEYEPTTKGSDDPDIYVTGFKHNNKGRPVISLLLQQDIYTYFGEALKTPEGEYVDTLTVSVDLERNKEGEVVIRNLKWVRSNKVDLKKVFPLNDRILDIGGTALGRVVEKVESQLKLTSEPTFDGGEDAEVFITDFKNPRKKPPTISITAGQDAFDYAGDPLETKSGKKYEDGLWIEVSADAYFDKEEDFHIEDIKVLFPESK